MSEREIRQQLEEYCEELEVRAELGRRLLRKALLPAALGATLVLAAACEATPIALPYMGPQPDGLILDRGIDGPVDLKPAPDAGVDAPRPDAAADASVDLGDAGADAQGD